MADGVSPMTDQIARTPKQVGEAIRRHRRSLKIAQVELSAKAHLRQATISGIERGEPGTQLSTLFEVLLALKLELVVRPRTKASTDSIEKLF
jgi:HTH-type transcriptional regulator/antitoxin HipB